MKRLALLAWALSGCAEDVPPPEPVVVYPHLAVRADQKSAILARLADAPFDALYAQIVARAERDFTVPEEGKWDWRAYNKNACISQASSFLAWLHDDAERAEKPRRYFRELATDYENHNSWDLNIRMPYMAVCGVHAWDFLMGSGFFPAEEASAAQDKLVHIAQAHFEHYVMDPFYRYTALEVTQNNHPLRTASTLALTGMAFPDAPGARDWLGWALAEYDYLFSEEGHYIQAEGGVSEGPHYYFFGISAVLSALIAAENGWDASRPSSAIACRATSDRLGMRRTVRRPSSPLRTPCTESVSRRRWTGRWRCAWAMAGASRSLMAAETAPTAWR